MSIKKKQILIGDNNMDAKSSYISLSSNSRIRKEHFGGIIFNKNTGTIIEVDREAYRLLSFISDVGVFDINDLSKVKLQNKVDNHGVNILIKKLIDLGILIVLPNGILNKKYRSIINNSDFAKTKWPAAVSLSAPETVHWAVTFKCDSNCPDCYVKRHKDKFTSELETNQALELVDYITDAGVFQLAIGGGEPFTREDILKIVKHAWEKGLVVHITTGRYNIENNIIRNISKYIQCIQIGIKHYELITNPEKELERLVKFLNKLENLGIDVGANLILSNSTISHFDKIISLLNDAGLKRITLLRYKPTKDLNQWAKEKPEEDTLLEFEKNFLKIIKMYLNIKFRVDCGLTFLEKNLIGKEALYYGIRGCTAADRIVSIAPDGSVFPCSQLVGSKFCAGNLLVSRFNDIWNNSKILKRYRSFRTNKAFIKSKCGQCKANRHCGGCRVFADDALGADLGCSDPPNNIYYQDNTVNAICNIQDTIEFTNSEFPYVTSNEIKSWLQEENNYNYPKWLLNNSNE